MDKNNDEQNQAKSNINWYPGHMAKTKREIKEKIDLIDIVYEVVDSRMPLSSRVKDIDDIVRNKPRVLIMTKYDLCDKEETDKLIKYYEDLQYKVIPVDLMNGKNVSKILTVSTELLALMNEKRKEKGLKPRSIRALIVGAPNVGKSTLINRLVGKKAVNVGNRPGVTKNLGWIRIHKDIELLDSPGILWPKLEDQHQAKILASFSSIKEEILDNQELAIFVLDELYKLYPQKLEERYGITNFDIEHVEDSLESIAKKRGCLGKGGIVDYNKVYNVILKDLKDNNFGSVTFDRV